AAQPVITFDQTNWWIPVTVTVSANRAYVLPAGRGDLFTFPKQPHLLSALRGPLQVDGGTAGQHHTLGNAVILPHEVNTPPFGIGQQPSEARQVDVLNVFDDGSRADQTGDLTSTALTGFGMGPAITFAGTTSWGEPNAFPGGISYGTISVDANGNFVTDASKTTIEVLNVMLGQGNDRLIVHSTMIPGPDQAIDDKLPTGIPSLHGGLTVLQGGGNALLQVTGSFSHTADSVTRNDNHSWTEAGFAIGQQVNLPWAVTLGSFTITGFAGTNGQTMLLRPSGVLGLGTTDAAASVGTVSVYNATSPQTDYIRIGGDHIFVLDGPGVGAGSPGPSSPLVIFGDTSQDGIWYSSDPSQQSGHLFGPKPTIEPVGNAANFVFPLAQPFQYSGNDFLDASALDAGLASAELPSVGVTIYGGPGQDTILGSQAGDILAGGSGDDLILGGRGRDLIYGDSGLNIDVITRVLTVPVVNTSTTPNADALRAGHDVLIGEGLGSAPSTAAGNSDDQDVIFGDHGVIVQDVQEARTWALDESAGVFVPTSGIRPQRLQTTTELMSLQSVEQANGAGDTLEGDLGNDILIGGGSSDTIWGNDGNDLAFGDFGYVGGIQIGTAPTDPTAANSGLRIDAIGLPFDVPLNDHTFGWTS
ncbi:MAG TPA: hypothetical protein VL179_07450, partial [Mycobacterium sp.]|nr:hypothetical protein [Mycobacterium sp.]